MITAPHTWLALALLALALPAQTKSNLLVIVADDVGVDAIATWQLGSSPAPTPNLDALAAGGVRFDNAWSCPTCSPTRAALQTGRHGFRTGIGSAVSAGQSLAYSEWTLPEVLGTGGYQHALVGKWHLGTQGGPSTPNQHGWSRFAGFLGGSVADYYSWSKVVDGATSTSTKYATSDTIDEALAWIGTRTGPWLCVVCLPAAHSPFHAPPASLHTQDLTGKNPGTEPIPFYKAAVQAMDTEIGRLLASISPSALAVTTIVFLGDNGTPRAVTEAPFAPTHAKDSLYEGGVRVPLIVKGKDVGSPGRRESSLVQACDLFATLCELGGVDARQVVPSSFALDSLSFAKQIRMGGQSGAREHAYTESFGANTLVTGHAIRGARYKLIRFVSGTPHEELYDLVGDPFEKIDLLKSPLSDALREQYLQLGVAAARAREEGWFATYGRGCGGSAGTPVLSAPSTGPQLGQTFTITLASLPASASAALAALGASRTSWLANALPLDLALIGMSGCSLWTSLDVTQAIPASSGSASFVLTIPNVSVLTGGLVHCQCFALDPGANLLGVVASEAGAMVID